MGLPDKELAGLKNPQVRRFRAESPPTFLSHNS